MSAAAAAAAWERWAGWYEASLGPVAEWFCRAVDARPGLTVLDAGCGAGFPALALARRVVPGGRVVAADLSPDMAALVARRARAQGLDHVEARAADLAALPFAGGAFGAVTCGTALMFCPDPVRAAAEMLRVLESGGRLAVAVWAERRRSPYFDLAFETLGAALPVPRGPDMPGPFRLAAPGALEAVLRGAGVAGLDVETLAFAFECASPEEYVESFTSLATGVKERLAALPEGEGERLCAALAERARQYQDDGGRVRLGATLVCACARKPPVPC